MKDVEDIFGIGNSTLPKMKETNNVSELWVGMPEFIQDKQTPFMTMTVRIGSEEALNDFMEVMDQKLTKKTKSCWFPKLEKGKEGFRRWFGQ